MFIRLQILAIAAITMLSGCATAPRPTEASTQPAQPAAGQTLYEQRLIRVYQEEQALEAYAARDDADPAEARRRFRDVAADYASLIADNPNALEPRLLYGKLLNQYGDLRGARDQFHGALRIDPSVAVAYQQLSVVHAEEGDFSSALVYALEAVNRAPEEAVYHYGVGELLNAYRFDFVADGVFTQETLEQQMMAAFEKAAQLQPDQMNLRFRFAEAHYDLWQPDFGGALREWDRILAHFPDMTEPERHAVQLHRARCLAELEYYEEAREAALTVDHPAFNFTRDDILEQIGDLVGRGAHE